MSKYIDCFILFYFLPLKSAEMIVFSFISHSYLCTFPNIQENQFQFSLYIPKSRLFKCNVRHTHRRTCLRDETILLRVLRRRLYTQT